MDRQFRSYFYITLYYLLIIMLKFKHHLKQDTIENATD
ncbi:hypothetical protein CSB69_3692 [Morganella morganii]|nr:hypothetical protein CSB69_3692 [Morganella morganii]